MLSLAPLSCRCGLYFAQLSKMHLFSRRDTVSSIKLGEEIALSVLCDRARTYNERFTVTLTKLDGNPAVITNH